MEPTSGELPTGMSNERRSMRDIAVDVLSGAGLGLLLGIVVGLASSPVVAIVVGGLTSLLAVFLGLESGGDSKVASLAKVQLNGVRIGSFGLAAALGVIFGLYIRISNPFVDPPTQHLARWQAAFPDNPALARQMMIFERTGITPSTLNFDKGPGVAVKLERTAAHQAVLFGSLQGKDLCRELAPTRFGDDVKKTLQAYDDQGEPLATVAAKVRDLPDEHKRSSLVAVHAFICKLEKEELLK